MTTRSIRVCIRWFLEHIKTNAITREEELDGRALVEIREQTEGPWNWKILILTAPQT